MNPSLLIVDDDEKIRRVLENILSKNGFDVTCAPGAEEAVRILTMQECDLVIMDLNMPGMNGLEALRAIRLLREDQRIVVLTGYSAESIRKQALEAGANAVFFKPPKLQELIQSLRDIINQETGAPEAPGACEDDETEQTDEV